MTEEKKEKAAKIKEAREQFKAWLDALPLGPKMEFPDFTQKVRVARYIFSVLSPALSLGCPGPL